ncbi:universal stress protein [Neolewinella antarctica]|uniref:Nucleotide-binding universal stress UspA family protein n=1 Tax=Neolewinella antarctica TaxID=442734 RepID=A0ABX0XFU4_9BACT|nr:universal stress protein [Neolewinella antarctica]NJC28196.1 nucleotide-binding universal stress UspA family protein [Neolewinella antarctica]
MRKILIPTDFSPIADNAMKCAIEIATRLKGELHLHHAYTMIRKVDYNWNHPSDQQPFVQEIERQMSVSKRKFTDITTRRGLDLHTEVVEEHVDALFRKAILNGGVDLIVMGSKGTTGLERVVLGSVAESAMTLAEIPVLIVPPGHAFPPLERIVVAIDGQEIAPATLRPLRELALGFGAEITILYVDTGGTTEKEQQLDSIFEGIPTVYRKIPVNNTINDTVSAFVEAEDAHLLCMIKREKGFFDSLFKKSVTKDQLGRNDVPLLVLPKG